MNGYTQIPQSPEQRGSAPHIITRRLDITEMSGRLTIASTRSSFEKDMQQAAKNAQRQIQEEKMKYTVMPTAVEVNPTINPDINYRQEQPKTQLDFSRPVYGANASYNIPEQPAVANIVIQNPVVESGSNIQAPAAYDQERSISEAQANIEDAYRNKGESQNGIPA